MTEKTYQLIDLQDEETKIEMTLEQTKEWYIDFWYHNPPMNYDGQVDDGELQNIIMNAHKCETVCDLNNMLEGIDYQLI